MHSVCSRRNAYKKLGEYRCSSGFSHKKYGRFGRNIFLFQPLSWDSCIRMNVFMLPGHMTPPGDWQAAGWNASIFPLSRFLAQQIPVKFAMIEMNSILVGYVSLSWTLEYLCGSLPKFLGTRNFPKIGLILCPLKSRRIRQYMDLILKSM